MELKPVYEYSRYLRGEKKENRDRAKWSLVISHDSWGFYMDNLRPLSTHDFYDLVKLSEVKPLSCVQFFVIPWTVAYHTPPSMGFSRQEYWSGLPFPSPMT